MSDMLTPEEERYYRNTINDFGLGHPKYSHTYFIIAAGGEYILGLPFTPVGYITVRINNVVLSPSNYSITGSNLQITPALVNGDVVIVVGETA